MALAAEADTNAIDTVVDDAAELEVSTVDSVAVAPSEDTEEISEEGGEAPVAEAQSGEVSALEFTGNVGTDVSFAENTHVDVYTETATLNSTSEGSETFSFEAKAKDGYKITDVIATVTGSDESKTKELKLTGTDEISDDTGEINSGSTKYTIKIDSTTLGDDINYSDISSIAISFVTEAEKYTVTVNGATGIEDIKYSISGSQSKEETEYTTTIENVTCEDTLTLSFTAAEKYSVTVKEGEDNVLENKGSGTNYKYVLTNITKNTTITISAVEITYTVTFDLDNAPKATVYQVTAAGESDVTYTKGDAPGGNAITAAKGETVYFVVVPETGYSASVTSESRAFSSVSGATVTGIDGTTTLYKVANLADDATITITTAMDHDQAYQAAFTRVGETVATFTVDSDDDEGAEKSPDGMTVYTLKDTPTFIIKAQPGYDVEDVKKQIADSDATSVNPTPVNGDDKNAVKFIADRYASAGANAKVTYEVTLAPKGLTEGTTVTFNDEGLENFDLNVTEVTDDSEDKKVRKAAEGDTGYDASKIQYTIGKDVKYLEFKLTAKENAPKVVPVVKIGSIDIEATNTASPYAYKIPTGLLANNAEITITEAAQKATLTVNYDAATIDSLTVSVIKEGDAEQTVEAKTNVNGTATYEIDLDAKIKLAVAAKNNCTIDSYQMGEEKASEIGGDAWSLEWTFTADTNITINSSARTVLTLSEKDGDEIEAVGGKYNVNYGKAYVASVAVGSVGAVELKKAVVKPATAKSTVEVDAAKKSATITVDAEDAGKTLTVELYDSDAEDAKAIATFTLVVAKKLTTGIKVEGVGSNGVLKQTVDTQASYKVTANSGADINNIALDIAWDTTATDDDKKVLPDENVVLKDGALQVTTPVAKDDATVAALNKSLALVKINLVDAAQGKDENGVYKAVLKTISLQATAPALTGITPTVGVTSITDVDFVLNLGAKNVKAPKEGKVYYEVTVAPKDAAAAKEAGFKDTTVYYFEKEEDKDSRSVGIEVYSDHRTYGYGKKWSFDVTVKLVQTLNGYNLEENAAAEDFAAKSAEALTSFVSKSKAVATATKDPYYATTLKLKKGTTTLYTGQKDVKIATVDFGKDTTFIQGVYMADTTWPQDSYEDYYEGPIALEYKDGAVYMSVGGYDDLGDYYPTDKLGKHTIRVTAFSPDQTYASYADITVTVNRGVEQLELKEASDTIYKTTKKATLKVTPIYNEENYYGNDYKPKSKKVTNYVLVAVDEYGGVKTDENGKDVLADFGVNNGKISVKNGTITVDAKFDVAAAKQAGKDKFIVRATGADYKGSTIYGYSNVITVTNQGIEMGSLVITKYDYQEGKNILVAAGDGQKLTSDDLYDAEVQVLKKGATVPAIGAEVNSDDILDVDTDYLTFKSSNSKAIFVSQYGYIRVDKVGKTNITVSANDGSKASAVMKNLTVENAKPIDLALQIYRQKDNDPDNCDEWDLGLYEGQTNTVEVPEATADTVLRFVVMRKDAEGEWDILDEYTNVSVSFKNMKPLTKASGYKASYYAIANKASGTVTLKCDGKDGKINKTYTINNAGVKTTAAPAVKLKSCPMGNTVLHGSDYEDGQPSIIYQLTKAADIQAYKGKVVMVRSDAADRYKNKSKYTSLEWAVESINDWVTIDENGAFKLNIKNIYGDTFSRVPVGSYKLQLTYGIPSKTGGFIAETKSAAVTLKVAKPKTVKGSYKPISAVKMSLYDTAAGKLLTGSGKNFDDEVYGNADEDYNDYGLLNANITGQANNFTTFFELTNVGSDEYGVYSTTRLKLRTNINAKASESLKAQVAAYTGKAADALTDAEYVSYITTANTKEAKNDRIGYVPYDVYVYGGKGWISDVTKITVSFDTKKAVDKYTLGNVTVLEGAKEATVDIACNNKQAYSGVDHAYVSEVSNGGKISVDDTGWNTITFKLDDATSKAPAKYKTTVYIVPNTSYYATEIDTLKDKINEAGEDAAKAAAEKAYNDAIVAHGVKLTTNITVGANKSTGGKIAISKAGLNAKFSASGDGVEDCYDSGYDVGQAEYWINVYYDTKINVPEKFGITEVVSGDTKLATARADGSKNLVQIGVSHDNDHGEYILIHMTKADFDAAVAAKKVKYSTDAKAQTISVSATLKFGTVDPEKGEYEEGKRVTNDNIKTEKVTFKLTLPIQAASNSYAEAVKNVKDNATEIAKAAIPNPWWWNGEGLSKLESIVQDTNYVITNNGGEEPDAALQRDLYEHLEELLRNTEEQVRSYAPEDSNTIVKLTQLNEDTETITLAKADFTAPTPTTEGTLVVKVNLIDATTLGEDGDISAEDPVTVQEVVPITLTLPATREKPYDLEEALVEYITKLQEQKNPSYGTTLSKLDDPEDAIAEAAREALGISDYANTTLRLSVEYFNYKPATDDDDACYTGTIKVWGYLYGGKELEQEFTFKIDKPDNMESAVAKVTKMVNTGNDEALTVTNADPAGSIIKAVNAAVNSETLEVKWKTAEAGDVGTYADEAGKDCYKIEFASRTTGTAGSVKGKLVVVDTDPADEENATSEDIAVDLEITAPTMTSTAALAAIKAAVGIGADDVAGAGDTEKETLKALIIEGKNTEAGVKTAIENAATAKVKDDGYYTVSYKVTGENAVFAYTSAKQAVTGDPGQEAVKGSLKFTLVLHDAFPTGGDPTADVEIEFKTTDADAGNAYTFDWFGELQTLAEAEAAVKAKVAALEAENPYSLAESSDNEDNAKAALKNALNPLVTGACLEFEVDDVEFKAASEEDGSFSCTIVISDTSEDANPKSVSIDFEVTLPGSEN